MVRPAGGNPLGFLLIGASKLVTAALLGAAGFGIFRLLHGDVGATVQHVVSRLHLDPENRLVHAVAAQVGGIDHARLKALGAGTFFYCLLELVEGVGLLLRRRWAPYLTVVATGLLLIPEGYELAHKVNALRVAVLVVNLVILVYLVVKVREELRASSVEAVGSAGGG